MSIKETTPERLAQTLEKRAPSALCGDAAAVCAALALALGGAVREPLFTTLKFGEEKSEEPTRLDSCEELGARLFKLADDDCAAEEAVRLAIRKPAMLPGEREEKAQKLLEALCAAAEVTLNLLRAVGEAVKIMAARDEGGDLELAGASAGLALCSGAIKALESEAYARAARITDENRARNTARFAQMLCEQHAATADEAQKRIADKLRAAVMK